MRCSRPRDIGANIPTIPFRRPNPTIAPFAQPVIAREVVRYVGEPIAVVLADSAECAEDAVGAVSLDIEHLQAVTDYATSSRGDIKLFNQDSNCASLFTAATGDTDAAFRDAVYTHRENFRVQRMTAMTMETRGLLAQWDEAQVT